jgi:N-acetylglucosamine-6-phosphate deacetylase
LSSDASRPSQRVKTCSISSKSVTIALIENFAGVCITQAKIPGYADPQVLWVDPLGKIQRIQSADKLHVEPGQTVLDVAGDWISLGGVDLQINGALGLAFPDLDFNHQDLNHCGRLAEICKFLWQQGIDGFLPTIVTTAIAKVQQSLAAIADFSKTADPNTAQILGAHLEGPFLNPAKRGAHPEQYLLPLNLEHVKQILGEYAAQVKVMTLAPELDPSGAIIPYLKSLGITVSLGHSLATAAEAQQAFAQGATMVTHAFNAMPGLHHREPGLLGAALTHPQVWCGVIADGKHICPTMLDLLLRVQTVATAGCFLVSDALSPLGLPDGFYPWDDRQIQVINGTAYLPDGTLSGTTLSLLAGVQNLVHWGICSLERAIALATEAPRQAIGLPGLSVGQPARQLLRWHQNPLTGAVTWERLFPGDLPS